LIWKKTQQNKKRIKRNNEYCYKNKRGFSEPKPLSLEYLPNTKKVILPAARLLLCVLLS
jgi:hypothetical protein